MMELELSGVLLLVPLLLLWKSGGSFLCSLSNYHPSSQTWVDTWALAASC